MASNFNTMGDVFRYIQKHIDVIGYPPTAIALTKEEMLNIEESCWPLAFPNVEGLTPNILGVPLLELGEKK